MLPAAWLDARALRRDDDHGAPDVADTVARTSRAALRELTPIDNATQQLIDRGWLAIWTGQTTAGYAPHWATYGRFCRMRGWSTDPPATVRDREIRLFAFAAYELERANLRRWYVTLTQSAPSAAFAASPSCGNRPRRTPSRSTDFLSFGGLGVGVSQRRTAA
jgi:hypothetical protein